MTESGIKDDSCNIVGGVLSPLLANIYMRRFVRGWKALGHERRLKAVIVNYADDRAPGNVCSR
jgi:hypothetical protein